MRVDSFDFVQLENKEQGIERLADMIEATAELANEKVVHVETDWGIDNALAEYRPRLTLHAIVMYQSN